MEYQGTNITNTYHADPFPFLPVRTHHAIRNGAEDLLPGCQVKVLVRLRGAQQVLVDLVAEIVGHHLHIHLVKVIRAFRVQLVQSKFLSELNKYIFKGKKIPTETRVSYKLIKFLGNEAIFYEINS